MEADFERKKVTISSDNQDGEMIDLEVPALAHFVLLLRRKSGSVRFECVKNTATGLLVILEMELSIINGPKLVVALDIGSTYSGYAWQERAEFETNRSEIHFNTSWGAGALQLHKTTTCILLECQKNEEGAVDQKQENLSLSQSLSGIKGFHRELLVEDQIGQQLPLFDVMSLFIKTLKDHCLKKLKTNGVNVELSKTLFVVTVPAIWSDEAKKFMRDAAVEAGIGKRNVLLALEPEAAAIYCLHLPEGQRKEMNDLGMKGQKFLVADLGVHSSIILT
ncbi:heat shock 70 kDa protein 12B-like [Mercenaria mercenaria]|uniref:heat shock 70 kDa protein 12B-like n=1 Tax=Mercenaria mercenaria TaxID=6596 RepID=UPI00234EB9DE|nr:heat shock 70 kDa protein 12B-like [Mercenaria mercenaria]